MIRITIQKKRRPTNDTIDRYWYGVQEAALSVGGIARNIHHQVDFCRYYAEWLIDPLLHPFTEADRKAVEDRITGRRSYDGIGVQLKG